MMTIRQCAPDDKEDIAELLKEFHEEALKEYGLKFEGTEVYKAIEDNRENAMVLEVNNRIIGVIAGKIVEYPLQKTKLFQEIVWFVSKNYRLHGIRLLKEMENRCKAQGIGMMIMVAMGNSMTEKLDKFYKRIGYRLLETHYLKAI
ncbi:MAG: GNAT family N-acetyltransferase [Candidatus Omnitrophota bacterium]